MNEEQELQADWRRLLPLAGVLGVTALLALSLRGFVENVVLQPVLFTLWFLWLVIDSAAQWIFWALFLLFALVLALRSLARAPAARPTVHAQFRDSSHSVSRWRRQLQGGVKSRSRRWRIARDLGMLIWREHNPDEPYRRDEMLALIDSLPAPAPVRAFLAAGAERDTTPASRWRFLSNADENDALALDPDVVIRYLEEQGQFDW